MKSKRGVQIQFNWLFVLIVGFIIIILVTSIVMRQRDISESSRNVVILNNLDAILAGSEVSTGTSQIIRIPQSKIEFECNRYAIGEASKQLNSMNVFVPSVLEDSELITLSLDWSLPYRVLNLLYITSPRYRYVIVGNVPQLEALAELIPNETFVDFYPSLSAVPHRGEDRVRFIVFDTSIGQGAFVPPDFRSIDDEKISGLSVDPSGDITFFTVENSKFTDPVRSHFPNIESLAGAIITDDAEIYHCVMDHVFERMHIINEIYQKKVEHIQDHYAVSSKDNHCDTLQATAYATQPFERIATASTDFRQKANVQAIQNAAEQIRRNNKMVQLQSCAIIY